jgi:chemotaxis protein methyltransferase CheR
MDVVFVRNVLIYFGNHEKEIVLDKIWECLKPGGLLLVSLSESLVGVNHRFKMEKNSLYRKT